MKRIMQIEDKATRDYAISLYWKLDALQVIEMLPGVNKGPGWNYQRSSGLNPDQYRTAVSSALEDIGERERTK